MYVKKFKFRILVLGGHGVGKSALDDYLRIFKPTVSSRAFEWEKKSYIKNMGYSFSTLNMDVKDFKITLLFSVIFDYENSAVLHPSLINKFIRTQKGAILLYDITNASSIHRLPYWLDLLSKEYDELPMVLAGNKVDLVEKRAISREEGLMFQREHGLTSFREISLKTGEGVYEMFEFLRDLLLKKYIKKYSVEK